jgi:hypothetical protein
LYFTGGNRNFQCCGYASQLQERIKRLEEAGDKMEAWLRDERLDAVQHTVSKWNKAKEDKP